MKYRFLIAVSACLGATPAVCQETPADPGKNESLVAKRAAGVIVEDAITTGVAKARDRLNSATSTSVLKEGEIQDIGARSTAEIFRYIPGVRSEIGWGDGTADITVRGLPMASTGAKFLQLEEDGLPVLEFGDINLAAAGAFLRMDLNVAQIESIRGGSSSTFASNSPGGVINLISKSGDAAGGSLEATTGLNYDEKRLDFDYGAPISDTLRFHVGGFYRVGEGPRRMGFDADKGGQFKFNLTKTFDGGYVRLYGKFLDDRTPTYIPSAMMVTGTDSDPSYDFIPGYKLSRDFLASPYLAKVIMSDGNNQLFTADMRQGQHAVTKAIGLEARADIAGWTVTDRFRYAKNSGTFAGWYSAATMPAATLAATYGGAGATLAYANGPDAGQAITAADNINGNGLLTNAVATYVDIKSLDYAVNDLRASKVWHLGGGDLTATVGFYKSAQTIAATASYVNMITDLVGGGRAAAVNIFTASGTPVTQNGYLSYGSTHPAFVARDIDVDYDVNAPFGSLNYMIGKLALGASVRYDFGKAQGTLYGAELGGGRAKLRTYDVNGDGVISLPETKVGNIPLSAPAPVNYDYHYLSYSFSANYRIAEPLSVFARYSRGARANADRLLYTAALSTTDGSLLNPAAVIDYVRQAEAGMKYRGRHVVLNATVFYASTQEHNSFFGPIIDRRYRTYGLELESSLRFGPFALQAGATYTKAKLVSDATDPTLDGNTPRRQPELFYSLIPQVDLGKVSAGAAIYGTTSNYGQDVDVLKVPGYVTVSPFLSIRPAERLTVMVNVNNVFDVIGVTYFTAIGPVRHAGSILNVQTVNGRTASASVRFDF